MDNIDQQWDEVLLSMSKHFGVTVNFEFLIFAIKNPIFFNDVDAAIPYFDNDKEIAVAKEVAIFG